MHNCPFTKKTDRIVFNIAFKQQKRTKNERLLRRQVFCFFLNWWVMCGRGADSLLVSNLLGKMVAAGTETI
jgi:hypothetical protein